MKEVDEGMMGLALGAAREASVSGEVPVGAVVGDLQSGEVVSVAHNRPLSDCDPTAHAEVLALREAGRKRSNYRLTGLGLWVTLEPCAMCAGAILHARIGRLCFAASDSKGGAILHGARIFDFASCAPEWGYGLLSEQSALLLRSFFAKRRGG